MTARAIFGFLLALAVALPASAGTRHGWSPAGALLAAVRNGNAFALSDGRVVSVGMIDESGKWPATTQSWTRASNNWTLAQSTPALPLSCMAFR